VKTATKRRPRSPGRPHAGGADAVPLEKILDAALEVFADVGYEGTSILQLTRQLGVCHNLLHARLGSKRAIWEAAVGHGLELLRRETRESQRLREAGADPAAKLHALFVSFLLALAEHPAILKLMNYEGARQSDRLDYIAERFLASGFDQFQRVLAEGVATGVFREVSPAALFLLLSHGGGAFLCLRPLARHLGERVRRSGAVLQAQVEDVADLLLRGVLK
jgi:AcrR family transcriptional regulator